MERQSKRWPAQYHLWGVIAAAVIPLFLFSAYLFAQYAISERERFTSEAMAMAQQASVPVESYLTNLSTILDGLSRSAAIASNNLEAFREEANRWVVGTKRIVVLRDAASELVSTAQHEVSPLRATPMITDADVGSRKKLRPWVSGVYFSDVTKDYRVAVLLPLSDGKILQISGPTSEVLETLLPVVAEEWTVGVGDRGGNYVTRSKLHEKVTGTPGLPEYVKKVVGRSGTFVATNFQGETLLAGYYRSPFSGWFYTANVPLSTVKAPVWRSISAIGMMAVLAMVVSGSIAYVAGNRLARAAAALAKQAQAVGRGQTAEVMPTSVEEFGVISSALHDAQESLALRTGEVQAVLETAPAAIWVTYDAEARLVIRNRFAAELMGLDDGLHQHFGTPDEVVETVALKNGQPVLRQDRPLSRAMRGESVDNQEYTYIVADGAEIVLLSSARPIRDASGAIMGAVQISLDISERKKAWLQRQLLVNELNHRVKNTLAVVQSVVSQTLRNAPDLPSASTALSSRIASLSKAHDLLTRENWNGANLGDLVKAALEPLAQHSRFETIGEPIWVPASIVLSLSLSLHELATNAVKYGALSNETGHVTVSWTAEGSPQRLRMEWREHGGPLVEAKGDRKGFGTRLLEGIFDRRSSNSVTLDFASAGLICNIEIELGDQATDTISPPN